MESAKKLWGANGELKLIRGNENWVYSLEGQPIIFRFTADYHRSLRELEAELEWIQYLKQKNCKVVAPRAALDGMLVHSLDPTWCVSVFERAAGVALRGEAQYTPELFSEWGRVIGEMHRCSLDYTPRWARQVWDQDDGVRLAFGEAQTLGNDHLMVQIFLDRVHQMRSLPKNRENFGLIHADVHDGNFFVDNRGQFTVFDFDDSVYHWFLFDLAVVLARTEMMFLRGQSQLPLRRFQNLLLEGYSREMTPPLDVETQLELFVQYRMAHSYLWAAARIRAGRTNDISAFKSLMDSCQSYFRKIT